MNKTNGNNWLDYVAIAIIVIAFFVISYCGFFMSDDIMMNYGVSSIRDVFTYTKLWYRNCGGRLFSVASQYLFSGVFGNNKLWFDVTNTMFFAVMIFICGWLVEDCKRVNIRIVLVFALLFWFLYPEPKSSLFWVAGSTTYLWGNTLTFVFLAVFQKYKEANSGFLGVIVLFLLSMISATEFITCASVCGAFVVYYIFNFKELKHDNVPLVIGFIVGSLVLLLAPGNYERAAWEGHSFQDKIQDLITYPFQELLKFRALWLFVIAMVFGYIRNSKEIQIWIKRNSILILSLAWSVIAFSVVFRPLNRALFFTESIALVLFLKFVYENGWIFETGYFSMGMNKRRFFRSIVALLVFVLFLVDSVFAVTETMRQNANNDKLQKEIVESGGVVALDRMVSSHRMAYVPDFPKWTWEPLAAKYDLDSVHIYPFYCQDKFFDSSVFENAFVDEVDLQEDNDVFGKYVRLIVRAKTEALSAANNRVSFKIEYTRPKKWYKSWLDKWRNYQYDRTAVVERDAPDVCFDGYCYYVIWFGRDNVDGLKSIKYEIE